MPVNVDCKAVLHEPTSALFSLLREVRKALTERDRLPPYAVFTNEQVAEVAKARCASTADLARVDGIGPARIDKYGAALLEVLNAPAQ